MFRGPTGRNVWLDLASLEWAVAYAVDELSQHGISTSTNTTGVVYRPNFPAAPGVWKCYNSRFKRIEFQFVEEVDGLPAGNLRVRRCLSLSSLTAVVWPAFSNIEFKHRTLLQQHQVSEIVVAQWC